MHLCILNTVHVYYLYNYVVLLPHWHSDNTSDLKRKTFLGSLMVSYDYIPMVSPSISWCHIVYLCCLMSCCTQLVVL